MAEFPGKIDGTLYYCSQLPHWISPIISHYSISRARASIYFRVRAGESRRAPSGRKSRGKDQAAAALISHRRRAVIKRLLLSPSAFALAYPPSSPTFLPSFLPSTSTLNFHSGSSGGYQTKPVGSTGSLTENELLFNGNPAASGGWSRLWNEKGKGGGSFETSAITRWGPPRGANFIEIDYRSCLLLRFLVPFRRSHVAHRGDDQSVPPPFSLFGCTTYTIRAGRNLSASRPCCSSPSHSPGKLIPVCPFVFSPSFLFSLILVRHFSASLSLSLSSTMAGESFASSSHSSLSAKLVWNYALREEGG